MNFIQRIFRSETIQNPINEELEVKENADKKIDILNDFIKLDSGGDDVDEGVMGLVQYFDDLFTKIKFELYLGHIIFSSLNFLV